MTILFFIILKTIGGFDFGRSFGVKVDKNIDKWFKFKRVKLCEYYKQIDIKCN